MSAEASEYKKRSQPPKKAAIVVFVVLLLWTLAVSYGCFRNASHLNYAVLWEYGFFNGFTMPLFIVLPLALLTLITGLYFIFKKKIVRANVYLFTGNVLICLIILWYSSSKTLCRHSGFESPTAATFNARP